MGLNTLSNTLSAAILALGISGAALAAEDTQSKTDAALTNPVALSPELRSALRGLESWGPAGFSLDVTTGEMRYGNSRTNVEYLGKFTSQGGLIALMNNWLRGLERDQTRSSGIPHIPTYIDPDTGLTLAATYSSQFGPGVTGQGVIGNQETAIGTEVTALGNATYANIGWAHQISRKDTISGGLKFGAESASAAYNNPNYRGILKGGELNIAYDHANTEGPFKNYSINTYTGKTGDTNLGSQSTVTQSHRTVDTPNSTEHWTDASTTTLGNRYIGSNWIGATVDGTANIGDTMELQIGGGGERNSQTGTRATGSVELTGYNGDNKWTTGIDRRGGSTHYRAGYVQAMNDGWSAQAGINYSKDTGTLGGLGFHYDSSKEKNTDPSTRYTRPTATGSISASRVVSEELGNHLDGLANRGQVATTTTTTMKSTQTGETLKTPSIAIDGATPTTLTLDASGNASWNVVWTNTNGVTPSAYLISLDGGAVTSTTATSALFILSSPGSHTVTITPMNGTQAGTPVSTSVVVSVAPDTTAPVANSDSASTAHNTGLTGIDVLANDTDNSGVAPTLTGVLSHQIGGIFTVNGGRIDFTPTPGFSGTASVEYQIKDGNNNLVAGVLSVTVDVAPPILIDSSESITYPTLTITQTSVLFAGGGVTDSDNPSGYTSPIVYVIKEIGGTLVSANTLTPGTDYTYQIQYNTYNGATNTLTTGKLSPAQSFTTLAAPNTPPSAVNYTPIGTPTAGSLIDGQSIGQLSCTDMSPVGAQNSCTYGGGDGNFSIEPSGAITVNDGTIPAGTYIVPVDLTDADGLSSKRDVSVVVNAAPDPAPVAGGAFAALADMTVSDNAGFGPITINVGGVTDVLSRNIIFSAVGLPNDANGSLTIDSSTESISGTYDALGGGGVLTSFTITVTATPQGGTHPITKTFVLSIRNDG